MTRKKLKIAYITSDSVRKVTFKKRKKGLMKKISELSTLCDVEACAIVYSSFQSQPEVWPSPSDVQRVLTRFTKMPVMQQSKNMMNQESFLGQKITKVHDQLKKEQRESHKKEMEKIMFQGLTGNSLHNLNMIELNELGWLIQKKLEEIDKRVATTQDLGHPQVATASIGSRRLSGMHATAKRAKTTMIHGSYGVERANGI